MGKNELSEISKEETEIKQKLAGLQRRRDAVFEKKAIEVVKAVYNVRDALSEVVPVCYEVNKRLSELEKMTENYLSPLEKAKDLDTGHNSVEVKFLYEYLFSGVWKSDADFWTVLRQISDNIGLSANPFSAVGGR